MPYLKLPFAPALLALTTAVRVCRLAAKLPRSLRVRAACLASLFAIAPVSAKTPMQEYVEAMQPGWNLGNSLDASGSETAWGNAPATQELIQAIAAQGFRSIRIPVTWDTGGRVGPAPDYTIDPAFLDRVQQIVDWSLEADLYVMLNLHHDSGWVRTMPTNHDAVLAKFNALWSQIAARFRDHSNKLHFESINEPEFDGVDDATKNALLHELNTSFFHIVRGTGGGNATRPLVLPSVVTNNGQEFLDALKETITELNDPNLIATVHDYGYWPFSVNIAGVTKFDGTAQDWTTEGIDRVYNTLVSEGIPVVVGEFGLLSFGGFGGAVERGEVIKFFEFLTGYCESLGITFQWWDAGAFFNRNTYEWNTPELYSYVMHSVVGRSSTAETDLVFLRSGTPIQDAVIKLNLNGNTLVSLSEGGNLLTPGVDYTLAGDILTLKAGFLASYATGEYGEKAVLTASFNDGVPWKFFVRHQAAPALGAASGTKSGALVIPTSFNGDVLATVEANYAGAPGYPYPGPAEWTAFKLYGDVYEPDYGNNTITIKKEFFAATTNEPVDLTFHFWSGKTVNYRLEFEPGGGVIADPQELLIYDNQFYDGWGNWSWTPTNENSEEVVHSPSKSIAVDANPWAGSMLGNWMLPLNRSDYRTLTFWANGGEVGGQRLTVSAVYNWAGTGSSILTDPLPANTWTEVEIPLASLGVTDSSLITGLVFSNNSGNPLPRYYLDDVRLTTAYPSWIVFVDAAPAPVVTSSTLASGVFDAPFSYTITAINDPVSFTAVDLPPGLGLDPSTGVISGTPSAAGSYLATVTAINAKGAGSEQVAIEIAPASATVALSDLEFTYDGSPKSATVATSPAGLPVTVTYNGGSEAPVDAGSYTVVAAIADPNYSAPPATGTLIIEQAAATISLLDDVGPFDGAIKFAYDGAPRGVAIDTDPADLPVTVTYNGSTTVPTLPGTYQVVVTSNDPNYSGSVEGTLEITVTALVRQAPTLDGHLEGSLQLLNGQSFGVNSSGMVSGDLLLPGTPTVMLNGSPTLAGVVDATGAVEPSNYGVTLSSSSVVRYVMRRVDPIEMPVVTAPAAPTGTRNVSLNNANRSIGDFATLRNLTLNGNVGTVAVPPGAYGHFTVNGNGSLAFGVPGATEAAVYDLQGLTLNGNAQLKIVGPVIVRLGNGLSLNGTVGSSEHPEWLALEFAQGGLTLNGNARVFGQVTAPQGAVIINGELYGRVSADRLTINGGGLLEDADL